MGASRCCCWSPEARLQRAGIVPAVPQRMCLTGTAREAHALRQCSTLCSRAVRAMTLGAFGRAAIVIIAMQLAAPVLAQAPEARRDGEARNAEPESQEAPAQAEPVQDAPAPPTPELAAPAPASAAPEAATPDAVAPPAPASSQKPPVSFVIEKIVVVGVHHGSEGIVASETLLTSGNAYTEAQLREALQRVERLPFVVMADFSLRRGSARGRFELVITAVETKPVFFGGVLGADWRRGTTWSRWMVGGRHPGPGGEDLLWTEQRGQCHCSAVTDAASDSGGGIDGTRASFTLAYRHHDLFGRHIVGTLEADAFGSGSRGLGAELAVPVTRTSVITLGFGRSTLEERGSYGPYDPYSRPATARTTGSTSGGNATRPTTRSRRGGGPGSGWAAPGAPATPTPPRTAILAAVVEPDHTAGAVDDPRPEPRAYAARSPLSTTGPYPPVWPSAGRRPSTARCPAWKVTRSSTGTSSDTRIEEGGSTNPSGSVRLELLGVIDPKRCGVDQCWWSFRTTLT